jgi:hypothetical protein
MASRLILFPDHRLLNTDYCSFGTPSKIIPSTTAGTVERDGIPPDFIP